jgi:glyoxylase-like metal-dependent hydrolase (beta-lactamase superfamily II)
MSTLRSSLPRLTLCTALLAACVASSASAQQDLSKVQITANKLPGGIAMLTGAGGNIGVSAGEDGVFLIDDQFAPLTEKIRAAVKDLSDAPIRFVINTHWHGDHTGGNENMGKAGAVIVAHENVRKRMSTEQFMAAMNRKVEPSPKAALPLVTFTDSVTFHVNGHAIHAFHVAPAHTDGDVVLHFRDANVIHAGDVFFSGRYPLIDVASGGSIEGMIAADDRILALSDEKTAIMPGHGPISDRAGLAAFRNMLVTVRDRMLPLVKAKKSLKDIVASHPTKDLDEKWGKGFLSPDEFVEMVYMDLNSHMAAR